MLKFLSKAGTVYHENPSARSEAEELFASLQAQADQWRRKVAAARIESESDLTESQRDVVAAKLATIKHGANRHTLESPIGDSRIRKDTRDDAAT